MSGALLKLVLRFAVAALLLAGAHAIAAADEIDVRVQINGDEVIVDASCFVRATPREVWAVMTDYDSATTYISNLERSVTLSRANNILVVSQKGSKGFGPFTVAVETVNEIHLTPFEKMQARRLSGSMKKYTSTTRLVPEESGTRIVYRAESIPDVWIPPIIGQALIEDETRTRFEQLRDEIIRRKALASHPADRQSTGKASGR